MSAPWVTTAQVRERRTVPGEVDDDALDRAVRIASDVLSGLSGLHPSTSRTVVPSGCGCGEVVTGPHERSDVGAAGVAGASPFFWRTGGGDLVLAERGCACELALPANPVIAVESVVVDGVEQDPGTYELVDASRLRRLGGATWRAGRVAVTFTHGYVPEAGLAAATLLALELAKADRGMDCALTKRVTSVSRQGVSFAIPDPQDFLEDGRTGLPVVDLWLVSLRQSEARSSVLSPDSPRFDTRRP